MSDQPSPTVKLAPTFKAGDTVALLSDPDTKRKVILVTKEGNLRLEGLGNLTPPTAVTKA